MVSLHVFAQGIHVFNIHDVVEQPGTLSGRLEVVNANRFDQKLGFLQEGRSVFVLVGGRRGILESVPDGDKITIRILE